MSKAFRVVIAFELAAIAAFLLFFIACSQVPAPKALAYLPFSNFNGDTLRYLKYNFEERASQYSGKSFEVLMNDLEIPVKFILPITSDKIDTCVGFIILFEDFRTFELKSYYGCKIIAMGVNFDPYLNLDDADNFTTMMEKSGNWNSALKNNFGSKIIKDPATWAWFDNEDEKATKK